MSTVLNRLASAFRVSGLLELVSHEEDDIASDSLRTAHPLDVVFRSRDGRAKVHASLLTAREARAAVVLVVGQVGCWGSDARVDNRRLHVRTMAQALRARGLTVLVTALRGHGESERHDVLGAIDYLLAQGYVPRSIGILGASMGASAALLAAAEEPAVQAVVADSPRIDVRTVPEGRPAWLMPVARWMGRLLSGVDVGRRPLLGSLTTLRSRAVLIIHGLGDRVVPPSVAQAAAKVCGADLWLTASHTHAGTLHEALPLYITRVVEFFCQSLQPLLGEPPSALTQAAPWPPAVRWNPA